jgi:hypothetical protein
LLTTGLFGGCQRWSLFQREGRCWIEKIDATSLWKMCKRKFDVKPRRKRGHWTRTEQKQENSLKKSLSPKNPILLRSQNKQKGV